MHLVFGWCADLAELRVEHAVLVDHHIEAGRVGGGRRGRAGELVEHIARGRAGADADRGSTQHGDRLAAVAVVHHWGGLFVAGRSSEAGYQQEADGSHRRVVDVGHHGHVVGVAACGGSAKAAADGGGCGVAIDAAAKGSRCFLIIHIASGFTWFYALRGKYFFQKNNRYITKIYFLFFSLLYYL